MKVMQGMGGEKSFWKKLELTIAVIMTLLFIYSVFVVNQKINFILGNDMAIILTPNSRSLYMHYGDSKDVDFDISIDNFEYCGTKCSYSFNDRSSNVVLDNGSFEIGKREHFLKKYSIGVKRLGSGQDIYGFDLSCRSVRSYICLTKGDEKFSQSLVIANYDLSEAEKELKKELRQNLTRLLESLRDVDYVHQQLNQRYFELAHKVNLNALLKDRVRVNEDYAKVRLDIEKIRSLWSVENYSMLSQLLNESYPMALDNISELISGINNSIDKVVSWHNELLLRLRALNGNFIRLNAIVSISAENETMLFAENVKKFSRISSLAINNTFESYEALDSQASEIESMQTSIMEQIKNDSMKLFFESQYYLTLDKGILCAVRNSCTQDYSFGMVIAKTESYLGEYPDIESLVQNCNSLGKIEKEYYAIRSESQKIINETNATFPAGSEFAEAAGMFKDGIIAQINNSYYNSYLSLSLDNKINSGIAEIAAQILPKNLTEIIPVNYNESFNISLFILSGLNPQSQSLELVNKCSKLHPLMNLEEINFPQVNPEIGYKNITTIDTSLSDNPPICCIFKECRPCCSDESCKNDPTTFPVILLHGHSVSRYNSPDFSLDAFDRLQIKLQENGYLNAGVLLYYDKNVAPSGEGGLSGKPLTVRVTYYYDIFTREDKYDVVPAKSESIDTYAIRLNDIIEAVKDWTGKPKVNIIAFSMGGLVTRKYMQIYGDSSVYKFITIATPHNGLVGRVALMCPLVGENKECDEMQRGSLFLNKLNDINRQASNPGNIKIHAIIGKGCSMGGVDGDGVVQAELGPLKNILKIREYFVNGTCSGSFDQFHTALLDIEAHPEVYADIIEILKEK